METVSCSYIAGMLLCFAVLSEWHICVTCVLCRLNKVYVMGGQLVFDWDSLENFVKTRDRPVCNTVTNTKSQS